MAKQSGKNQKSQSKTNLSEFVVVTFAQDSEQAREYQTLLENNDIPTMVKESKEHDVKSGEPVESADSEGIAIMVPEECLDEAHVIVESQGAYDDFYDFALDDEDNDEQSEYDDDNLGDNF